MRVSLRKITKIVIVSFICAASLVIFINNVNNVHYQSADGHVKEVKQENQNVIGNSLKRSAAEEILVRRQRTAKGIVSPSDNQRNSGSFLDNIFISVKTTVKNHSHRLTLLLDTWISNAKNQTYIFTDASDAELEAKMEDGHVINTNCSKDHNRKSLVCKMAQEFDWFINSKKRWFCHVDDDTYLNIPRLVTFLQQYNHTDDWYLGRPSLDHPIEVMDRPHPGQNLAFWFATGGAGFCLSRALSLKMVPYAGGGRLMRAGEQIRLPDDCTIGFIIDSLLHKELTVIKLFHSHLEALWKLSLPDIKEQISFSYSIKGARPNVVNIHGFSAEKDPTRFLSIHCHLHPFSQICLSFNS